MTTKNEVLQACTIEGNIIKLPGVQLERKLYQEVAKSLELIGGKWKGRPVMGFVFHEDPTELLQRVTGGEKINIKKEYQFFETPADLADELVKIANIKPGQMICEPSAGQGAIIKAIHRHAGVMPIYCFELMEVNRVFLDRIPKLLISEQPDFLKYDERTKFDRIIANPPFSKNQDIDHIKKMYSCLNPGGRLISIASKHWQLSTNKKETDFRNWLYEVGGVSGDLEPGAFKESGTMIAASTILINKL